MDREEKSWTWDPAWGARHQVRGGQQGIEMKMREMKTKEDRTTEEVEMGMQMNKMMNMK